MSGGSVLGSQKAGVQARHQDPPATVLRRLKTGIVEIARYQAVAFVYWTLRLQVQGHVPWTSLVHGFERHLNPCSPDLRRMGQSLGYCRGGTVARSEVEVLLYKGAINKRHSGIH